MPRIAARPPSLARLERAAEHPVAAVIGMAGSGKSTAVAQWLAATGRDARWVTLDARDNDVDRLTARLADALQIDGCASPDELVDALLEAPDPPSTPVVVIDDLHALVRGSAQRAVARIVDAAHRTRRLLLLSRAELHAAFAPLRASGELTRVDGDDLAMDATAVAEALECDADRAAAVVDLTGGWPLAVGLVGALLAEQPGRDVTAIGARARRDLADYLVGEVIADLGDDRARDVLALAPLLDELTVTEVEQLTGHDDLEPLFAALADRRLLIADDAAPVWRAHAVVRDVIADDLETRRPGTLQTLHARAADVRRSHAVPAAIAHLLAADRHADAAELYAGALLGLQSVPYETQLRWLLALPEPVLAARTELATHASLVAAWERRFDLSARWAAMLDADAPDAAATRTLRAMLRGDLPALAEYSAELLEQLDQRSTLFSLAHGCRAGALGSLGRHDEAAAVLMRMLRSVAETPAPLLAVQAAARAAIVRELLRDGHPELAASIHHDLVAWTADARIAGLEDLTAVRWSAALLARHSSAPSAGEWPDVPARESALGLPFLEVWLLLDHAATRDDPRDARTPLLRAQAALGRFAHPGLLADELAALGAAQRVLPLSTPASPSAPAAPSARELLTERERDIAVLLDSELSQREIADHLYLSANTVKSHLKSIYRKLGVTSRVGAIRAVRGDYA